MKILVISLLAAGIIVPTFISADLGSLVGDECLVPIYHTDFAFPPEGGKIVRYPGGQMYFVRTYLPGCANAGNAGVLISTTSGAAVTTTPFVPVEPVAAPKPVVCY